MARYAIALGLPVGLRLPDGIHPLLATIHAQREAQKDFVDVPNWLDTERARPFEVVTNDDGQVVKVGYRLPLNDEVDFCLVCAVESVVWRVITLWLNRRDDNHRTLRRNLYALAN